MRSRIRFVVLWLAIAATVALALYPPWRVHSVYGTAHPWGFAFLFSPPRAGFRLGFSLDWSRLITEWLIVWIVATGLLVTLGGQGSRRTRKSGAE